MTTEECLRQLTPEQAVKVLRIATSGEYRRNRGGYPSSGRAFLRATHENMYGFINSFVWSYTEEGHDYWYQLVRTL